MVDLDVRRYQDGDRVAVWELHNLALHAVGAHAGNGPWDDDLHHIQEVYLDAGGEFLVGLLAGRIVAIGALRRQDEITVELKRMRVNPDLQRRGLGRIVLRRLEERARELGYRRLVLDTTERQVAAIALYRSEGFTETGRGQVFGFPCIFFAKELAPKA
ncbi:MAG: GNAT family N-acetyltransferase [Candidatus Dormibacteria bacterium]|jgi:ribosomal protein S18 acetylase RimI-like enzyme